MVPSAKNTDTSMQGGSKHNVLAPGVYVPTVAFFSPDDSIDVKTTQRHAVRLAKAGITGLVTHGSNGEAVHLSHAERSLITKTTREALDTAGFSHVPVIVGTGTQSTRETIELCKEAGRDGGSHVLVLPPAYYGSLLSTEHIIRHFEQVADASPLPVLIYNFPGACAGLDLSSDTILALAQHPNICGTKLTCGNTGKLARVMGGTLGSDFRVFGGSADFLVQGLAVGGHGVVAGLANVAPKACLELVRLWNGGHHDAARKLQYVVARGDWAAIQGGFVSVKTALQRYEGYGGKPREPCTLPEGGKLKAQEDGFAELIKAEKSL
jgi:4-hydroxy-2-oxoglutarate aldolase